MSFFDALAEQPSKEERIKLVGARIEEFQKTEDWQILEGILNFLKESYYKDIQGGDKAYLDQRFVQRTLGKMEGIDDILNNLGQMVLDRQIVVEIQKTERDQAVFAQHLASLQEDSTRASAGMASPQQYLANELAAVSGSE